MNFQCEFSQLPLFYRYTTNVDCPRPCSYFFSQDKRGELSAHVRPGKKIYPIRALCTNIWTRVWELFFLVPRCVSIYVSTQSTDGLFYFMYANSCKQRQRGRCTVNLLISVQVKGARNNHIHFKIYLLIFLLFFLTFICLVWFCCCQMFVFLNTPVQFTSVLIYSWLNLQLAKPILLLSFFSWFSFLQQTDGIGYGLAARSFDKDTKSE